jgi:phenylacetate-CoA ligase
MECWDWPPKYDRDYRPADDQPYWFPHRETMDPELREAMILQRIQAVMGYAYERAPFYRHKWDAAGIKPGDIKTMGDFENVPVVTKEELRRAQAEHPPFGDYVCVPGSEIARVHGTSGTTGRPTAFGIGRSDWEIIGQSHARAMWAMGIRPSDTVFVGSVFSLYMGSWAVLNGAERLGAAAFPFGAGVAGMTERAVGWLTQMKPTVFYGTPSYALRLAEAAIADNIDPHVFGLRIMFFSGEPGASLTSTRHQLEQFFGAEIFDSGSMAEMTPWTNLSETTGHTGMLLWQDMVYTEVTDPATHRRVPFGAEGTPVYTHLERTSQPMIRLVSGDLTRWECGPSPCGRTYPYLPRGIYGRIDDQFTVRGENIYPSTIDEIVSSLAHYGGEHRIVVSRDDAMDTLVVQIEYGSELAGSDAAVEVFESEAAQALRRILGVRVKVAGLPRNTLDRTDHKARRVIDQRDLFREFAAKP